MGHLVDSLAQTNQSERPGRIEPLRPAYQIDRHSYRYGAYTAYEAYRPRPLPRTLRIRVSDRLVRFERFVPYYTITTIDLRVMMHSDLVMHISAK